MSKSEEVKRDAIKSNTGGPHGVGDPEDKTLRRVELEVLIPKKMRDIAKEEKCVEQVEAFTKCCQDNGILMVATCRKQNSALKDCLTKWYENEEFKGRCKKEYLEERSEYRRTGIPQKRRVQKLPISM